MTRFDAAFATIAAGALCCFIGCENGLSDSAPVARCQVLIEGEPATEVRVILIAPDQTNPVLEGITDLNGMADLRVNDGNDFDDSLEQEFRVVVDSLGDWQIKKPWSDREKSQLNGKYIPGGGPIVIELPKKAISLL